MLAVPCRTQSWSHCEKRDRKERGALTNRYIGDFTRYRVSAASSESSPKFLIQAPIAPLSTDQSQLSVSLRTYGDDRKCVAVGDKIHSQETLMSEEKRPLGPLLQNLIAYDSVLIVAAWPRIHINGPIKRKLHRYTA